MSNYRERIADEIIAEKLSFMGAVLVRGAKWCGKTTTCEQLARSVLYLGDADSSARNIALAKVRPSLLLEGTVHFTLLAEAALQKKENDTNFAGSCYDIVFGAAPAGWYDIHPDSFLGAKGRIGEVAMIADGWFDMDYLKSRLSRYWKPAEGCVFIVR